MKNNKLVYPLLAIAVIFWVTLACGGSSSGVKVGTTSPSTSAPAQVTTYKIGDIVQVGDQTIVLNSAEFQGNTLHANFTVENKGTSDLTVSSLMSFSAKDSEGTKLDQDYSCTPGLDGKVLSGDKLKGNICWSGATTATVKIYYEAELFSSGAVVWEISK
jgi:hypothetical protein